MPFQPGNKLGQGRPKGVKSARIEHWDNLGEYLTTQGANKFLDILKTCSDEDYIMHYKEIVEYFKPKLARTENKSEVKHSLDELTREQAEIILRRELGSVKISEGEPRLIRGSDERTV